MFIVTVCAGVQRNLPFPVKMFKFLFVCYNVTVSNNLLGKTHCVGKDVMLNSGASCETELFSSECYTCHGTGLLFYPALI